MAFLGEVTILRSILVACCTRLQCTDAVVVLAALN
jgi:hypothetical protein